jgi:hypothetical protein
VGLNACLLSMRTLPFVALMFTFAAGCGMSGASDDAAGLVGGGAGKAGSSSIPGELPTALSFPVPLSSIDLGAQVEVVVQATPPGVYTVRFSLPTNNGDPRDAILSTTEADTSATGSVSVLLTAPSSPTTFDLRASVDNKVTATLSVTAVEPGTATLVANPVPLGHRHATTWVATVHEEKTCDQVPGTPPEDGTHTAFADRSHAPEIKGVRTGIPLAVVLRSGFFMGGCASVEKLPTEATDTPHVVDVQVLDRPVDLAASNVALTLGVAAPEATWSAVMATARSKAIEALDGFPDKARTDVEALLAGMRDDLSGAARDSFSNARSAENWDALLQAHWGSSTKLTELVSGWLDAAQSKLLVTDDVFAGRLLPNVETNKPDDADLLLDSVVGFPAAEAGFVSPADVSWSAGPDDTIVLSTHVYFFSSTLLTRLAEPDVLDAYPGAASVGAALATALDCSALGSELASAGNDPQLAFAGCDAGCLTALCRSALDNVWQRARQATAAAPVQIDVAATGEGRVGDSAELAGIKGNWVGQLISGDGVAPITTGGLLEAAEPPLDAR